MTKGATDRLSDLKAFAAVTNAGVFRQAARLLHVSPSGLSDAVRRLESHLGVRLLHRTTRSILPTEQGKQLLKRIGPAFAELAQALETVSSSGDRPAGRRRLTVPVNVARLFLPQLIPRFLKRYPDIQVEVMAESGLVDFLAVGCDAGIRYDDWLEQDMIAVPVGPRVQRFATASSPAYLDKRGRPQHPRDLMHMECVRSQFGGGNLEIWQYQRGDETYHLEPTGHLVYSAGTATELGVASSVAGLGVIYLFEGWLRPYLDSGELEPVLEPWWRTFSGPYLYYSGRRLVPPPLRAFIDFIRAEEHAMTSFSSQ
ncbi:LysR family transcriptional regulator [Candidatus Sodalis endolongispinus]|uniref:LysR family transcriptional regulator n=1 Tax=Candidatus Sodalis endolongispinus TaxID=2812662 RepID=UPI0028A7110A|nr:LysR family transcriptional regulator [Candidatus Sodalis endolongispinus]